MRGITPRNAPTNDSEGRAKNIGGIFQGIHDIAAAAQVMLNDWFLPRSHDVHRLADRVMALAEHGEVRERSGAAEAGRRSEPHA